MNPSGVDTDRRPFVLVWELTRACELACDHCRAEAEPDRHPDELTTAEAKSLLDAAARFGDDQLVVFSGGDPLARPDAIELVEYGTHSGLQVTITPSGTDSLTDESIDDLAAAGLRRMALSIDGGDPAAHDDFRGVTGSFEATLWAARRTRQAGLPLQINTTVCARTVDDLPAIRDLVADLGAVLWSVFFLVPVGHGTALDPVSPARAEAVMEWLQSIQAEAGFGIKTTEAPHFRRVAIQQQDTGGVGPANAIDGRSEDATDYSMEDATEDVIGRGRGIIAGDGFAFVSHVGDVYPSGFLPEPAGTVREDDIGEIYRDSALFEALRDRDRLAGKCGACQFRSVCGGSRSRAYAHTGDPLASDPLCPYVPDGYEGPLPDAWDRATDRPRAD
ncbi:MAG: TIGR04053 family radical SAM/SPASM domain-containing protein [Haloarculaceae archaeon]